MNAKYFCLFASNCSVFVFLYLLFQFLTLKQALLYSTPQISGSMQSSSIQNSFCTIISILLILLQLLITRVNVILEIFTQQVRGVLVLGVAIAQCYVGDASNSFIQSTCQGVTMYVSVSVFFSFRFLFFLFLFSLSDC